MTLAGLLIAFGFSLVLPVAGAQSAALRQPVSRRKAIAASLLLPGLGQIMTGHKGRARLFFTAEAGILASYFVFQGQGHVRQDRYIDYAELFAGVSNIDEKEDSYYRNLGKYSSSAEYENEIARSARAMYGDDLEKRLAYLDQYKPGPDEAWEWASGAHRETFTEMRKDSRNSFRWADNMLGILLLNHVLSAVDAARSAQGGQPKSTLYATYGQEGMRYVGLSWNLQ